MTISVFKRIITLACLAVTMIVLVACGNIATKPKNQHKQNTNKRHPEWLGIVARSYGEISLDWPIHSQLDCNPANREVRR